MATAMHCPHVLNSQKHKKENKHNQINIYTCHQERHRHTYVYTYKDMCTSTHEHTCGYMHTTHTKTYMEKIKRYIYGKKRHSGQILRGK